MNEKILFVDDELAVLEGYKRILHKDFRPDVAASGEQALALMNSTGPYAVVVSDMSMPGMDGVKLLSRVREISPPTVRVILTGHADIQTAMDAVNEGHIFRFLTKPCEPATLKKTLTSCIIQYQLVTAEKELLENTLMGSIKVLTDVLSLANPAAFGRALRVKRYVQHIVAKLGLDSPWKFEVAAMLSQLGCVTLETELIEGVYCGKKLSPEEQTRFDMHPSIARDLLSNIPRLEGIAWIVGQQQFGAAATETDMPENVRIGAAILRVAIAFDDLRIRGISDRDALAQLRQNNKFDPSVIGALASFEPGSTGKEPRAVHIHELNTDMILQEEIRTNNGLLLVGKGQEVTYPLLVRLRNYHQRRAIPDHVLVMAPPLAENVAAAGRK